MSHYDAYRAKLSVTELNPRSSGQELTKRAIANTFKNSPSYYPVIAYRTAAPDVPVQLDSWIVDDSKVKELKQIQVIPNQVLNFGDVILWNNERWITTQVDDMGGIYYRGSIQRCQSSIKWIDSSGRPKEAWFTTTVDTQRVVGVNDGKVMTTPNERRYIAVQNNADTVQIKKEKRFIFDGNRGWRVTSINTLNTGVIHFELEEDLVGDASDNLELRIANYYGNVANYSVTILNGESFSIRANATVQLQAEVKNNGIVAAKQVIWSVSDATIATVNETGLLSAHANGVITVTAKLQDDLTVLDTTTVTVQFTNVDNYSIELDSTPDVLVNTSKTFTVVIKNNLVVDPTRTVQLVLIADDGVSVPTAASMTFNSTTQCTLKGIKVGYVKLKVTLIGSTPTLSQIFRVKVESLV